jgi:hypothetical protein
VHRATGVIVAAVLTAAGLGLAACSATPATGASVPCDTQLCQQVSSGNVPPAGSSGGDSSATNAAAGIIPAPTDFSLKVTITSQQCSGSTGCDIRYRITPTYNGPATTGDFLVTYSVYGASGGSSISSFTLSEPSGAVSIDSQDAARTAQPGAQLTATVTDVTPN